MFQPSGGVLPSRFLPPLECIDGFGTFVQHLPLDAEVALEGVPVVVDSGAVGKIGCSQELTR
jgi:hypothetical protein